MPGTTLLMSRLLLSKALLLYKTTGWYNAAAAAELAREASGWMPNGTDEGRHFQEAVDWLIRAHDAGGDGGVARGYGVGWIPFFGRKGWQPSCPETTGYIIPTFFDLAARLRRDDLRQRALTMADWELRVQMPNGAVMGGTVDETPTPAIFNTGQVMLGWQRAFEETGHSPYRDGLERAARFLVSMQDRDGSWRRGNSMFALATSTTYNARTGWALLKYGNLVGIEEYQYAGIRNLEYTMSQQRENGWFADNCLSQPDQPLTHTTCYAMEGLLGGYFELGDDRYLERVRLTADALSHCIDERGRLPGRFDSSWRPMVNWSCLTGCAQFAGVLLHLGRISGEPRYQEAARRLLHFLRSTQNCHSPNPGLRGGIKGSHPFNGDYGRYEVLSWATKFFLDALILEESLGARANAAA